MLNFKIVENESVVYVQIKEQVVSGKGYTESIRKSQSEQAAALAQELLNGAGFLDATKKVPQSTISLASAIRETYKKKRNHKIDGPVEVEYYDGDIGLTYYRKKAGIKQIQLAEKCGMTQSQIARWENGERELSKASGETLKRLADALECTVDDLLKLK